MRAGTKMVCVSLANQTPFPCHAMASKAHFKEAAKAAHRDQLCLGGLFLSWRWRGPETEIRATLSRVDWTAPWVCSTIEARSIRGWSCS